MGALSRFEAFVETLVEGSFTRLLGAGVQPVEIAKRIEREMRVSEQVGPGKIFVPNIFTVSLHPEDFDRLAPAAAALSREMVAFVVNLAHERGYTLLGAVEVSLEADGTVSRRQIKVDSLAATTSGAPRGAQSQADVPPVERTQALNLARLRGDIVAPLHASLVIPRVAGDEVLPLDRDTLSIGRALDNDLVVEDPAVSRHHAEIRRQYGRFYLTDLESTNGTKVNGKRVSGSFLQDGDRIRVGDIEFGFRIGREIEQ